MFPGATSNDFIHYIKPTLQNPENRFEIIHEHQSFKCLPHKMVKHNGVKNIFVSGFTINNHLHLDFGKAMKNALKLNCAKCG